MNMLNIYASLLHAAGFTITENDYISVPGPNGKDTPLMIEFDNGIKKRLILPTDENLKIQNWESFVCFHPLRENLLHGESKVLQVFRKSLVMQINKKVLGLSFAILDIAVNHTSEHSKLSSAGSELIRICKNANQKTLKTWKQIFLENDSVKLSDPKTHLTNVYLRKQGVIDGKKFFSVANWKFPLINEFRSALENKEKTFKGVNITEKDLTTFVKLFEAILPESSNTWMHGSSHDNHPFFDSLISSAVPIMRSINEASSAIYNRPVGMSKEEAESYKSESSFDPELVEVLEKGFDETIGKEYKLIPIQEGNDAPPKRKQADTNQTQPNPTSKGNNKMITSYSTVTGTAVGNQASVPSPTGNAVPTATPVSNGVSVPPMGSLNQPVANPNDPMVQTPMGMMLQSTYNSIIAQQQQLLQQQQQQQLLLQQQQMALQQAPQMAMQMPAQVPANNSLGAVHPALSNVQMTMPAMNTPMMNNQPQPIQRDHLGNVLYSNGMIVNAYGQVVRQATQGIPTQNLQAAAIGGNNGVLVNSGMSTPMVTGAQSGSWR